MSKKEALTAVLRDEGIAEAVIQKALRAIEGEKKEPTPKKGFFPVVILPYNPTEVEGGVEASQGVLIMAGETDRDNKEEVISAVRRVMSEFNDLQDQKKAKAKGAKKNKYAPVNTIAEAIEFVPPKFWKAAGIKRPSKEMSRIYIWG